MSQDERHIETSYQLPANSPSQTDLITNSDNPNTLLTLFIWFLTAIFLMLSRFGTLDQSYLSSIAALPPLILTVIALITAHFARKRITLTLLMLGAFTAVISSPIYIFFLAKESQPIMLYFYLIIAISTPVLLNSWSWKLHCCATAMVIFVLWLLWLPVKQPTDLIGLLSLVIAISFSITASFLHARRFPDNLSLLERKGRQFLSQLTSDSLPVAYLWNVLLLEAVLVVILLILDASSWSDKGFLQMVSRVWALVVIICAALAIRFVKRTQLQTVLALTTVFVAASFSISSFEDPLGENSFSSLPVLYLAFLVAFLPWSLQLQISVLWSMLLVDLAIKSILLKKSLDTSIPTFGYLIQTFRTEIALLIIGITASALIAKAFGWWRIRNLSQFVDEFKMSEESQTPSDQINTIEGWSQFEENIYQTERREKLIFCFFLLGIFSNLITTQYGAELFANLKNIITFSWLIFLLFLGGLVYSGHKKGLQLFFWPFAISGILFLFIWPVALQILLPSASSLWIFWPVAFFLIVGLVPWRSKERLPLILLLGILGFFAYHQLKLSSMVGLIFLSSALISILSSLQMSRRYTERECLRILTAALSSSLIPETALRLFAATLQKIFRNCIILCSSRKDTLELIEGRNFFPISPDSWPIWQIKGAATASLTDSTPDCELRIVSWLPNNLSFFDPHIGLFSPRSGIVVDILLHNPNAEPLGEQATEHLEQNEDTNNQLQYRVFIAFRTPFLELFNGSELQLTAILATIIRNRLLSYQEENVFLAAKTALDDKLQEQEQELSTLVHEINNTVQDMTLLCEDILERNAASDRENLTGEGFDSELELKIKRIAVIARSVAVTVSDAKRKREMEKLSSLKPTELIDLRDSIREIVSFSVIRGEKRRIFVEASVLPSQPIWTKITAREHFESILRNLLNNAISYSDPGGYVRLKLRFDEQWIFIDVIDNGPGISADELEKIFTAGYRGRSGQRKGRGLGLGLFESRRIAESSGGSLTVTSSAEGQGSVFTLKLPRTNGPERSQSHRHWALVIDDNSTITDFYCRLLRGLHLDPVTANGIESATAALKERGQPAIVITDLELGSESGLTIISQIRAEYGSTFPILVVSGVPGEDIIQRTRAAGATDFVAKPIGTRSLFARIQSLLPDSL